MTTIVLKVQKPIVSTRPLENSWLFYDERNHYYFQKAPAPEEVAAMGEDFKMYAEFVYPPSKQTFEFVKRVGDQPW